MPFIFRLSDLPKLDLQVDRGTDFEAWKTQWTSYVSLSGLTDEPAATKVQALTLCFSRETLTIVDNLGLTPEQKSDVNAIIAAIKRHVDGHINESMERRKLRRRIQQSGESFDDYLVSLRELAKTCNFCSEECTTKNIRDQIIEGVNDGDTVEHLLQQQNLTLDTAITTCRSQEAAKNQCREILEHTPAAVLAIKQPPSRWKQPPDSGTVPACPGCGTKAHQGGRTQCPAYEQQCRHCHKIGYYTRVCRARQQTSSQLNTPLTTPQYNPARLLPPPPTRAMQKQAEMGQEYCPPYMSTIRQVSATDPAPTISIHISSASGSYNAQVLPDSGADISAAGQQTLQYLNEHVNNLLPSEITPRAANGNKMHSLGKMLVKFSLQGREHSEDMHIYPNVSGIIISWKAAKALGILPEHYPNPIPPATTLTVTTPHQGANIRVTATMNGAPSQNEINRAFPTAFDGQIRMMEGEEFHISLTTDAKPFCINTPRSIPFAYRDELKSELDLLLSQKVIMPVTEVTVWCAPIVVTPKKNTDRIRMCVDLSHLNKYVLCERYQSLTPAQAVAGIAASEAKIFTILDALKGYHQCPLDQESQSLTTFITPFGRFKYLRAPYSICSISEHYNRQMTEAFTGLSGFRRVVDDIVIYDIVIYDIVIYDIVIYDSNVEDHVAHVKQFLQRCVNQNIALNIDKCKFFQNQVTFAGFQLSVSGYQIDESITEAISKYPTPTSRTEL